MTTEILDANGNPAKVELTKHRFGFFNLPEDARLCMRPEDVKSEAGYRWVFSDGYPADRDDLKIRTHSR